MPNPVLARAATAVRGALDAADSDQLAAARATCALDYDEWFTFQQVQAEEHSAGRLHTDDALIIYAALGGETMPDGGFTDDTDLATRITILSLMRRLLAARLERATHDATR